MTGAKSNGLIVVLSGRHETPDETPARLAYARTLGSEPLQVHGTHTRDEIDQAIQLATTDLTLVTHQYHVNRVLLTVVAALKEAGKARELRVMVKGVQSSKDLWKGPGELRKIAKYQETGDAASWAEADAYTKWRDGT